MGTGRTKGVIKKELMIRETPNDDLSSFELSDGNLNIGCIYNDLQDDAKDYAETIVLAVNNHDTLVEMLEECQIQLLYLNGKFGETGTTNSTLSKIEQLLNSLNSK